MKVVSKHKDSVIIVSQITIVHHQKEEKCPQTHIATVIQ
jgi:hypothetical protein